MSKNANIVAYGVMYVVKNKKSEVLALLLKNGVVVPSDSSDVNIALAVTNLLKVSNTFKKEFSELLVSQDVVYGMSANMSGDYFNVDGFTAPKVNFNDTLFPQYGTTTTTNETSTPTKDTKPKSSSTGWLNQGLGLLQSGFQGYLQLDENKTKRALADASVVISQTGGGTSANNTPPPTGWSTGAIVGVSLLGITVIGLVTYLLTKKK
jgi:hypothetical protein